MKDWPVALDRAIACKPPNPAALLLPWGLTPLSPPRTKSLRACAYTLSMGLRLLNGG